MMASQKLQFKTGETESFFVWEIWGFLLHSNVKTAHNEC